MKTGTTTTTTSATAPSRARRRVVVNVRGGIFDGFPKTKRAKGSDETATMQRLLRAIEPTSRGTKMTKDSRAEIAGCLDELKALSAGRPVRQQQLNGTWRLVWTSEKEILAIIKEGGIASWFGTEAGDVLQVIDLANDRLQNCIEFPPEGAFLVDSFIRFDEEDQKCSFQFSGAALKTDKRTIKLPPMGRSRFRWVFISTTERVLAHRSSGPPTLSLYALCSFARSLVHSFARSLVCPFARTLFVSQTHRVAFDDRGDYLVVERLGAPRDLYREYGI